MPDWENELDGLCAEIDSFFVTKSVGLGIDTFTQEENNTAIMVE